MWGRMRDAEHYDILFFLCNRLFFLCLSFYFLWWDRNHSSSTIPWASCIALRMCFDFHLIEAATIHLLSDDRTETPLTSALIFSRCRWPLFFEEGKKGGCHCASELIELGNIVSPRLQLPRGSRNDPKSRQAPRVERERKRGKKRGRGEERERSIFLGAFPKAFERPSLLDTAFIYNAAELSERNARLHCLAVDHLSWFVTFFPLFFTRKE